MKKRSLFICGLCLQLLCRSQAGLYINGSFTINANTTVAVDGLTLTPTAPYTISGVYSLVRNSTLTHPSTFSIKRAFQWNATPTAFTGNIGFYYDDTELNGLVESELTLNVHNGTQWQAYKPGVIRNTVTNVVTTPVNNLQLNELSLAAEAYPLPLKWGLVSATRENETVRIEWVTYHEDQTSFFHIERSTDGLHWLPIGSSVPAANSPGSHQYYFYDSTATNSKFFYRIKQEDSDRQYSYSKVVQLSAVQNQSAISIYPNPATHLISINSTSVPLQAIHLFKANGQLVRTVVVPSTTKYKIALDTLPKGVYMMEVQLTDGTTSRIPFIKN